MVSRGCIHECLRHDSVCPLCKAPTWKRQLQTNPTVVSGCSLFSPPPPPPPPPHDPAVLFSGSTPNHSHCVQLLQTAIVEATQRVLQEITLPPSQCDWLSQGQSVEEMVRRALADDGNKVSPAAPSPSHDDHGGDEYDDVQGSGARRASEGELPAATTATTAGRVANTAQVATEVRQPVPDRTGAGAMASTSATSETTPRVTTPPAAQLQEAVGGQAQAEAATNTPCDLTDLNTQVCSPCSVGLLVLFFLPSCATCG